LITTHFLFYLFFFLCIIHRIPKLEIVVNNSKTLKKKRRLGQEEDLQSLDNDGEKEKIVKQEDTHYLTILVDVTASDPFPFIQDILTVD
jgi:hypothetical protein